MCFVITYNKMTSLSKKTVKSADWIAVLYAGVPLIANELDKTRDMNRALQAKSINRCRSTLFLHSSLKLRLFEILSLIARKRVRWEFPVMEFRNYPYSVSWISRAVSRIHWHTFVIASITASTIFHTFRSQRDKFFFINRFLQRQDKRSTTFGWEENGSSREKIFDSRKRRNFP